MADINYMQASTIIYVFMGLLGLAVGSFLNVLIYRLPRGKKTIWERSVCPHCGQKIPLYLNLPVISFVILGGRCLSCRNPISIRYPLVEFLNALWYLFFLYFDGLTIQLPVHCFLVSSLIVIFFIDLEFRIIPDKVTIPAIIVGLATSFFIDPPGIVNSVIGFFVGGGTLLAVAYLGEWLFKKEAMGGGDIKMAAMIGAFVGWQKVLLVFFGGALFGMMVSLIWMMVSKKVRSQRVIPFGPFLALAAALIIVYGDQILRYYTSTYLAL